MNGYLSLAESVEGFVLKGELPVSNLLRESDHENLLRYNTNRVFKLSI